MDANGRSGSEPTPAEVEADQFLAVRTAYATLTAVAVVIVPPLGIAMSGAMPIFDVVATHAVKMLGRRRLQHAAETIVEAASEARQPVSDFIDKAVSDDARHELFARTLVISQDTALRSKRRALSRALANGVMGDEAVIDKELLFISAIADLSEMHIRALAHMEHELQPPGMSPLRLRTEDQGLGDSVYALFGTLESHGLIVRRMPGTRISGPEQAYYYITTLGQEFLQRLADDQPGAARS